MSDSYGRFAAFVIACFLIASHAGFVSAQAYPVKSVRVVIGYPAGSGNDVIGRVVMGEVAKSTGHQFVIDNRPGASGNIGAEIVARSAPDGYTLLNAPGSIAANQTLAKNLGYDLERDFEVISVMASVPLLLVVHPSLPVKSVRGLIDFAKVKPGQLTFASSGSGGLTHLAGELFAIQAGLKLVHIPYRGTSQANLDVINGQVSMGFTPTASVMPLLHAGRVRALAITSKARQSTLPTVPTLAEAAIPDFEALNWVALFAPRGTSADLVSRLNAEINRAVQLAAVRESLVSLGADPMVGTPSQWSVYVREEVVKWAKVIKAANVRVD